MGDWGWEILDSSLQALHSLLQSQIPITEFYITTKTPRAPSSDTKKTKAPVFHSRQIACLRG